jgi:MYXO-CTERM domain-containing protein
MLRKGRIETSILIGALLVGLMGVCIVSTAIASGAEEGTQAVKYDKLIPFLPKAPSGWDGEKPVGQTFTSGEGTWSMASSDYTKTGSEDVTANVMITDYALYTTGWTGAWNNFFVYESTEGYTKSVTVQGYPAWEIYTKDTGDYSLSVAVNERFLIFINTNSDKDTLYDFANAINYKGIGALGPGPGPTAQPTTQPTTRTEETPTEDAGGKTPGFELTFAVLGLLAVVALLVRRRG